MGVLYKITEGGNLIYIGGAEDGNMDDVSGINYRFVNSYGIAVDKTDNIYVSSWTGHTIFKINPSGVCERFAGIVSMILSPYKIPVFFIFRIIFLIMSIPE